MEIFLSICIGVGLSAACGFRVFVPLLCLSAAAHFNIANIQLAPSFAWIGSTPALIAFSVATLLEIAAYYVPWVDNLLDTAAVPLATVAGVVVTASVVTDIDPFWKWTLAVVAGGGLASTTQIATTKLRATSSATTGGLGNPVLATIENALSGILSIVAVVWPIVAFVLTIIVVAICVVFIWCAARLLMKAFRRKPADEVTAAS